MTSNRRHFLERCFSSSCGFYATLMLAPLTARKAYGQAVYGDILGKRPFGRIEKLNDAVWALVSTPFSAKGGIGDTSTHSNGGIIAGTDHVLAIDSYRTAAGARYMAEASQFLTGRLPSHIVNTHFHFDHLGGTQGFINNGVSPEVIMTQTTRKLAFDTYLKTTENPTDSRTKISTLKKWGGSLTDASIIIPEDRPYQLDLGGRTVTITPFSGHTGSDLTVTDDLTGITFGGDLIWDGIFPNFMSSSPSQWITSVEKILAEKDRVIVPGHGGIQKSNSPELKKYQILLAEIRAHAEASHKKGITSEAAAEAFKLTEAVGEVSYFREGFHEIAMAGWYRELNR